MKLEALKSQALSGKALPFEKFVLDAKAIYKYFEKIESSVAMFLNAASTKMVTVGQLRKLKLVLEVFPKSENLDKETEIIIGVEIWSKKTDVYYFYFTEVNL